MILGPGDMRGVGDEMLAANLVVLAADQPPQTGNEALDLVGVHAVMAIGLSIVDAVQIEDRLEWSPAGSLSGGTHGARCDPLVRDVHALILAKQCPREGTATAPAQRGVYAALVGAVLQEAAIDAVLALVRGAHMAAESTYMSPASSASRVAKTSASRSLCISATAVWCWTSKSRQSCNADSSFGEFRKGQMAPSRLTKESLRSAKIVRAVTLNW